MHQYLIIVIYVTNCHLFRVTGGISRQDDLNIDTSYYRVWPYPFLFQNFEIELMSTLFCDKLNDGFLLIWVDNESNVHSNDLKKKLYYLYNIICEIVMCILFILLIFMVTCRQHTDIVKKSFAYAYINFILLSY